jgi:phage shock protein PspC (stress-responsive transcriptional regulator)
LKAKLYRSVKDRKLGGVLGGLADYLNMDSSLLRIIFIVAFIGGVGSIGWIYLIWIFIVPNEGE